VKRTMTILLGAGLVVSGVFGVNVASGEAKNQPVTRSNVFTVDGKNLQSSVIELQKETPQHLSNSAIETKFKDDSYSFSLGLQFNDYKKKVAFKNEEMTKQRLQSVTDYLNQLTKNGTDFSEAAWLQNDKEWTKFVEEVGRLKYEDFAESEAINDLNVAGALILQAERYYDEPSLRYLYEVISDLNSGVNGGAVKFNVTGSFGNQVNTQEIHDYLKSKI
jgi:hypothetical protein